MATETEGSGDSSSGDWIWIWVGSDSGGDGCASGLELDPVMLGSYGGGGRGIDGDGWPEKWVCSGWLDLDRRR